MSDTANFRPETNTLSSSLGGLAANMKTRSSNRWRARCQDSEPNHTSTHTLTHLHTCMYIYICTYIRYYIHIRTYIHVHMCVWYIYMYIYVYTHVVALCCIVVHCIVCSPLSYKILYYGRICGIICYIYIIDIVMFYHVTSHVLHYTMLCCVMLCNFALYIAITI